MIEPEPVATYNPSRAQWLAERYASGESGTGLSALAKAYPDTVPSPMVVRRWRVTWPAFDALMVEAEQLRADALMEATVDVADSDRPAAQARNQIDARRRMAEALSPDRYRARDDKSQRTVMVLLTDAQLMAIARGADPSALLAGAGDTPTAPLLGARDGFKAGSEVGPVPNTSRLATFPSDSERATAVAVEHRDRDPLE
jgi:hypothetical protein